MSRARKGPLVLAALIIASSLWLPLAPAPALAAAPIPSGANITASPTQITPEAAAGGSVSGAATVINDGDQAYDFKSYASPYRVTGEDYDQSFAAGGASDAAPWISLPSRTIHLEPHATASVPYTIAVPAGTGGGGYYAVIFFETLPVVIPGRGLASRQRVGLVVYMQVNGGVTKTGNVASFAAEPFQTGPPLTAALRLRNSGNVHYGADITTRVTDFFGRPKATIHIVRQVLPATTRSILIRWEQAPAFGLFKVGGTVELLGRTEQLPEQYVLIMSAAAFVASAAGLLVIGGLFWWWRRGRRK